MIIGICGKSGSGKNNNIKIKRLSLLEKIR